MFKTKVIVGSQWGDEGKGKIVDYLAQSADVVIRYQGGNNAGHTIIFNDKKFTLNHIPSGIFNPNTINIMAQGMVINPGKLLDEMAKLESGGVSDFKLKISDRAHIVMPYHIKLDEKYEEVKSQGKNNFAIGTTKNGIGLAYEDKIGRIGIRMIDLLDYDNLLELIERALIIKNPILNAFSLKTYDAKDIADEFYAYGQKLKSKITNTSILIETLILENKNVVFESAQGIMLGIENGSYPYVTSSSPSAANVALGTGISTKYLNSVLGVVKAYTTRVGSGSLPTEILDEKISSHIRTVGHEYGSVTGRERRIGWLDIVALKHGVRSSGITEIAIMLLDVLDDLDEIKIAYAYELDGIEIDYVPASENIYKKVSPKFITLKGWKEKTTELDSYDQLPENAKKYLNKISDLLNKNIVWVSVGPDRKQTIKINKV